MDSVRWATFDCYGTLIDWNGGVSAALAGVFGTDADLPRLLHRYHQIEPEIQAERYRRYREVLDLCLAGLALDEGRVLADGEVHALSESLADWPAFPEVPDSLAELKRRGWSLAILSNCDRDLIAQSLPRLGVRFDRVIVAEDVGSYKPQPGHWNRFFELTDADPKRHVHVGASLFHDVAPAGEMGMPTVWVNRLGEVPGPVPDREDQRPVGPAGRARGADAGVSEVRLVRVPTAFGAGGEPMTRAAMMDIGVEEAATVAEATVSEQTQRVRSVLPERAVVLGGCCCTHVGAVAGLADRAGRVAVVWVDAHGDLNTPQTSPSGNEWGMPFRMILDDGHARVEDCCLIGARSLDPPEQEFILTRGLATELGSLEGVAGAYIAFDCDVLDPGQIDCFMPEPDGISLDQGVAIVEQVGSRTTILGMGLTGLVASPENPARLRRLLDAAGLG